LYCFSCFYFVIKGQLPVVWRPPENIACAWRPLDDHFEIGEHMLKKIIPVLLAAVVGIASPALANSVAGLITMDFDLRLINSGAGALTAVDVRDPEEYKAGHIPGAINIPVTGFAAGSEVLVKEKTIIVYCNSGGRSYNAYPKLMKLGYGKIGQAIFADCQEAGLAVEK
jgi:rhodanese-related sulfurtransferase